jgi:glycosyltransferase involved in cell wall biosynthesis
MRLRILFLYDFPLWGTGSATFLRGLVKELKKNHKVAVAAPESRQIYKSVKHYRLRPDQIPVFAGHPELKKAKKYADLSNLELTDLYYSYLRQIVKVVQDFEPHIIHVNHLSLISWVARYIKSVTGVRYIVTCHGSDLENISWDKRYYLLTLDSLRGASQVTVVSGDTRAWLIRMFGKEFSRKLRTIPGGIDLDIFTRKINTKVVEKRYGIDGKPVVLFVGRLVPQKGVKFLIKAAKKIDGEVFIVGSGPEMPILRKMTRELNLKNVHFTGYMSRKHTNELLAFYHLADVFVAPSVWQEPLGLVILEAMVCRTPVVVTRKGGIPLAVKERVNGLFVRPRNASEIAEKVNRILENKKLAKKLGENARKIVKEKFTWEKITEKFEYIYQKHTNLQ